MNEKERQALWRIQGNLEYVIGWLQGSKTALPQGPNDSLTAAYDSLNDFTRYAEVDND